MVFNTPTKNFLIIFKIDEITANKGFLIANWDLPLCYPNRVVPQEPNTWHVSYRNFEFDFHCFQKCMSLLSTIPLRGHSKTTWTNFCPILTTYVPTYRGLSWTFGALPTRCPRGHRKKPLPLALNTYLNLT